MLIRLNDIETFRVTYINTELISSITASKECADLYRITMVNGDIYFVSGKDLFEQLDKAASKYIRPEP